MKRSVSRLNLDIMELERFFMGKSANGSQQKKKKKKKKEKKKNSKRKKNKKQKSLYKPISIIENHTR